MVLAHEKLFYGQIIRLKLLKQELYLLTYCKKPYGKVRLGLSLNNSVINNGELIAALIDNAVACNRISGVNSDISYGLLLRH